MNINAFGTDNFLRHTIRNRMSHLEKDDQLIDSEGIDSLTPSELRHACQSRGIRSLKVDEDSLRKELGQWIELHLHRGLSPTLLILGRAFAFTRGGEQEAGDTTLESLKDALSSLPDTLVRPPRLNFPLARYECMMPLQLNETELEVSSDKITSKQRLAVLEEQEELIADESEQELKEEEARKEAKEAERIKAEKEEAERAAAEAEQADEMLPDAASTEAVAKEGQEGKEEKVDPKDVRMTSEQLSELGEALSILSAKSSVLQERQDLQKLMEENRESAAQDVCTQPSFVWIRRLIKGCSFRTDRRRLVLSGQTDSEDGQPARPAAVVVRRRGRRAHAPLRRGPRRQDLRRRSRKGLEGDQTRAVGRVGRRPGRQARRRSRRIHP